MTQNRDRDLDRPENENWVRDIDYQIKRAETAEAERDAARRELAASEERSDAFLRELLTVQEHVMESAGDLATALERERVLREAYQDYIKALDPTNPVMQDPTWAASAHTNFLLEIGAALSSAPTPDPRDAEIARLREALIHISTEYDMVYTREYARAALTTPREDSKCGCGHLLSEHSVTDEANCLHEDGDDFCGCQGFKHFTAPREDTDPLTYDQLRAELMADPQVRAGYEEAQREDTGAAVIALAQEVSQLRVLDHYGRQQCPGCGMLANERHSKLCPMKRLQEALAAHQGEEE